MLSKAISKYVRISPYKLRPIADIIRGNSVGKAYAWLKTFPVKRVNPIIKALHSAYANAKNLHPEIDTMEKAYIKEIKIDQGPIIRYFKPGAMGRANIQRKRLSHVEIVLEKRL